MYNATRIMFAIESRPILLSHLNINGNNTSHRSIIFIYNFRWTNLKFSITVRYLSTAPSIKMSKEAFLETGETLSLKCAILHLQTGEAVPEMHWFRGNSTVSLDEIRGGVLIETDQLTLTSHLQVNWTINTF